MALAASSRCAMTNTMTDDDYDGDDPDECEIESKEADSHDSRTPSGGVSQVLRGMQEVVVCDDVDAHLKEGRGSGSWKIRAHASGQERHPHWKARATKGTWAGGAWAGGGTTRTILDLP